jgi:hypothetical protein
MTAAYQAVSYLGFAASLPLAAAGAIVPPYVLLLLTAALALATMAWIEHNTAHPAPDRA